MTLHIDRITIREIRLALKEPFRISSGIVHDRRIAILELSDRDGGTELRLTHVQLPTEASRDDHNEGWNSVLDRLEKFVKK